MRGRYVVGIVLIIASVGLIYSWEKWGHDYFFQKEILVASRNVEAGEEITKEMVKKSKVQNRVEGQLEPKEIKKIIGMVAYSRLHKGEAIYSDDVVKKDAYTGEGSERFIVSLNKEIFYSLPESLKKGQELSLYKDGQYFTRINFLSKGEEDTYQFVCSPKDGEDISNSLGKGSKFLILYN